MVGWGRAATAIGAALFAVLIVHAAPAARRGGVPAPEQAFGFPACSDRQLASYEETVAYLRQLDAASDRLTLLDIGATLEGRRQVMAVISSAENLRRLARHREAARRLARARGLGEPEARALARSGRAVVWIDFGLHSTEYAGPQAAPQLAWLVASGETAELRRIRDEVILLLVPNMNPDGTEMAVEWYRRHRGTPFEASSPPRLYHRYAGHDNNRDWFMFNLPESRNVARQLYAEWFPQIVYNQHQEAPFPARIFIPPFDDPMNPNIPPLVMRGVHLVGEAMGRRFARAGKSGVVSRVGFDTWWNGGMRTAPYFHNMVGILTETGHRQPAPRQYDPAQFPATFRNGVPTLAPSSRYPSPWRGGAWRFADSCDYMLTASMAVLDVAARHREEWLYDIYAMGREAIAAGAEETWLVPTAQWDPGSAAAMIEALRIGGVEIERTREAVDVDGVRYAAGTTVIRGAQPFRPSVVDLFSVQHYPGPPGVDASPVQPYDITGWTLPAQMGVRVDRVSRAVTVATDPVEGPVMPAGELVGPRPAEATVALAIDPRANASHRLVSRALRDHHAVVRTAGPVRAGEAEWPAGTFLVAARGGAASSLVEAAGRLGVPIAALAETPRVAAWPLAVPRVGLYQAWGGNADEGWTRFVFDTMEVPVSTVHDADIRAGGLRGRFDVIVLPDASYDEMLHGLAPGSMPDEYVGGLTAGGLAALYDFTAAGGTLVALDSAAELPLTTCGIRWTHLTRGLARDTFSAPGALVRITVDPGTPLGFGMPPSAVAFVDQSGAFAPRTGEAAVSATVTARYADRGLLVSGWLRGETHLAGKVAALDIPVGAGRAVLLGFRAQHRGQAHGTFKLLLNTLWLPPTSARPVPANRLLGGAHVAGSIPRHRWAGTGAGAAGRQSASNWRR
jgi:hypothetical protein